MTTSEALARLRANEAQLRELGVEHLYLFGSTARDEAHDGSDIDLFFDHPEGSMGLFQIMEIGEVTTRILGCKADIMTRRSLHRTIRDDIQRSAKMVF